MQFIAPIAPPVEIYTQAMDADIHAFEEQLRCGGVKRSWLDWITLDYTAGPQKLLTRMDYPSMWTPSLAEGKPRGTALFLKSDIDAANAKYNWGSSGMNLHKVLQWLNYCLGSTCGVGLAYVEPGSGIEPHIRFQALPQSQMRGAIGWMYGPPLARNRTMQLSLSITTPYYILRLIQHEFGHFLGHYGSGSHSSRREDVMFASLQHIKAREPNWGYSAADIRWAVQQFGEAWINNGVGTVDQLSL